MTNAPVLVITAADASMTYGETVPTITASYSVGGVVTTAPICTTTATSASPIGDYISSCTGAVAAPGYTISYVPGKVTVTPAEVVITASSHTMPYGGTVPTITPSYSISGVGVTPALAVTPSYSVPGLVTTPPTCTTTATSASPSGSYPSTCTGAVVDPNYVVRYVPGTVTISPAQTVTSLTVKKEAQQTSFTAAGDKLDYTYTITNTGNVSLTDFSVTDNKIAAPNIVTCPTTPTTLAPGETIVCTATYTIVQADVDAGSVSNTAIGHAKFGETTVDSDPTTIAVQGASGPKLELKKEAKQTTFVAAGDKLDYTYTLTNTGNVTLSGPFTVTDDKITDPNTVTCPASPTALAHGESMVCTATYTVTGADVSTGSVANKAVAHAIFSEKPIDSDPKTITVSITPLESAAGATATAGHPATPPVTSSNGSSPTNEPLPVLLILMALAFGGLGVLAVQTQRGTIRS